MTSNSSSVFSLHPVFQFVFGIIQSGNTTWSSSWLQLTYYSLRGHQVMAGHCALLLMTSPLYAYVLLGSHDKPLPEGRLYKCKMVWCLLLALLSLPEATFHVGYLQSLVHGLDQPVLVSSACTLLTAVVSSQLTRLAQQRGVRWSAVLCLLWLSLTLAHTLVFLASTQETDAGQFPTWLFYLKSSVITCLLVLYGFSEREEQYFPPGVRKPCPEPTASWWSRLTFSWTKELLDKAYNGKLTEKDIFLLLPSDVSSNVVPRFTRAWAREVSKSKLRNQAQIHDEVPAATEAETLPEIPSPSPWEQAETLPEIPSPSPWEQAETLPEIPSPSPWEQTETLPEIPSPSPWEQAETLPEIPSPSPWEQAETLPEIPSPSPWEQTETLPEIPSPSPWEQAGTKQRRRTRSEGRTKHKILTERSQSAIHPRTESHKILGSDHSPAEKAYSRSAGHKDTKESRAKTVQQRSRPSLLVVLVRTFGVDFAIGQLYRLANVALHMTDPLIFGYLLDFMEDTSAPSRKGYAICALMMISKMAQTFMNYRTHFVNHSFALRIKSAVMNSIFNKVLTMDTESRQESTVGQAVNLLSVDTSDIREALTNMASEMWTSPAKIVLSLVLLYRLLGPSMLISMLLMVIMVPVTAVVTRRLTTMHRDSMAFKDNRLKMLTEVVNGIKILKMYAWEPSFISKLNAARGKELDVMWWRSFWETALHCYHQVMPYMISVVMFVTYVYSSEDHYLAPSTAFVAIALMDILRSAMEELPHVITHMVKVRVSFRRVNDFLNRTDLEDNFSSDVVSDAAISIENGFFSWTSKATPILKNINVRVKKGSLVAVVGTVGCGKSSLLSACLGEMNTRKGHVSVKGSVAYVPQQAWIQHASLRDNVLFGGHVDEKLYNQCLDNCALRTDLEIMPGGDSTEIGERGINLSGGQKQRVSLARAVYSQADVYMLDDPLSAVDCHVGSHIFDSVIGHQGMLSGKTRVLVTHGVQWLPRVDQIIVVRHGRVSEVGSYDELLSHNGPFAKFLKHYMVHGSQTMMDPQVEKMKEEILHRLESVTKDSNGGSSDDSDDNAESAIDNDDVIRALLQSATREETRAHEVCSSNESGSSSAADDVEGDNAGSGYTKKGMLVEDEEYKVQHATLQTFKEYARAVGYGWVVALVLLDMLQQSVERGSGVSLSRWTDDPQLANLTALPADSEKRAGLNKYYLAVYAGFGLIHAVSTLVFKLTQEMRQVVVARVLHNRMLSRVLRAPMRFFDTTPVGRIVSRFSSDLHIMDTELSDTMAWAVNSIIGIVSKMAIICYITPFFVLLIFPIAAVFYYVQVVYVPTMRQLERFQSKVRSSIYSFFSETLGGAAVVRAYGVQQRFMVEFQRRLDLSSSARFAWACCGQWLNVRMESLGTVVVGAVVVSAVTLRDTMTAGMVGLAVSVALDLTETVRHMVSMVSWVQTEIVSVDRIKEYSEMTVEADWRRGETTPQASWPQHGEIEINDLALRYREGLDLVLKGINVHIRAGEKVGIVGRTGAGKSSLTLALFRLVEPARGTVRIDDLDTNDLGLHDLRSRLTILPQDPVIFAGSLRMNLDPFAHFKDAEVWESLKYAHLSDFVSGLKDQLDHECGEGGENLSVGQRQLVCLARTLLHKTRVLVLDEATAAVDMETDDLIQRTIRSQFKHCTVLTIAHRLNTVIDYDKILVLDQGQVVEFDSPGQLMADVHSVFHHMVKKAGLLAKKPS